MFSFEISEMPANLGKRLDSAPPLPSSRILLPHILLPPRPTTRANEARRPRAPPSAVRAKVRDSEIEFVEVVVDDHVDVRPNAKVEPIPNRPCVRVAAVTVVQPYNGPEYAPGPAP